MEEVNLVHVIVGAAAGAAFSVLGFIVRSYFGSLGNGDCVTRAVCDERHKNLERDSSALWEAIDSLRNAAVALEKATSRLEAKLEN